MAELADFMVKRYGLELEFKNDDIRKCRITHMLTGGETWQELLSVASLGNRFDCQEAQGNRVFITGEGCMATN